MGDVIPFDPARAAAAIRASRPFPPDGLAGFAPAPDLGDWAMRVFVQSAGPLFNPRHRHLEDAQIGWLWTDAECSSKGRDVVGQCEIAPPLQRKWSSARTHWLFKHWFGETPDFIITVSAPFALEADDWSFCALIEHELCHAAQALDPFGEPRFDQEGKPVFAITGHDVEQFNDVVSRYGADASGVAEMVRLANAGPIFGQAQITAACGTCGRRTA